MSFDEDFIDKIADDPYLAVVVVANDVISRAKNGPDIKAFEEYEAISEGYSLAISIIETYDLGYLDSIPELTGDKSDDGIAMYNYVIRCKKEYQGKVASKNLDNKINHYKRMLGAVFVYEFSDGDISRIQTLVNELRENISSSEVVEEEHKRRLLSRLEKLQSELHKKMPDLDRFWGLVGEAGIVFGKFGKDSKPLVDRIREIADIVWRTQSRAEELPSDTPSPLVSHDDTKQK